jgi:hypothetical protein
MMFTPSIVRRSTPNKRVNSAPMSNAGAFLVGGFTFGFAFRPRRFAFGVSSFSTTGLAIGVTTDRHRPCAFQNHLINTCFQEIVVRYHLPQLEQQLLPPRPPQILQSPSLPYSRPFNCASFHGSRSLLQSPE